VRASFFGVSVDPADQTQNRVQESMPGIRFFWDFDATVSRLYGAAQREQRPGDPISLRRFWIVLDPTLRVLKVFPLAEHSALFDYLGQLPPPSRFTGIDLQAPILFLPNVFEPEFCRHLIGLYEAHGGEESGFMRDVNGKTVYGPRSFKPPPGGAVVFSCSLLHAVSRVTSGRRYAFLPFLYDDAAAKIREANAAKLQDGNGYRA
jgi:hypothetical protein